MLTIGHMFVNDLFIIFVINIFINDKKYTHSNLYMSCITFFPVT